MKQLLSRKEFSLATGIKQTSLAVYVSRGLVVAEKSGKIDTSHPENVLFMESHNPKLKTEARSLNSEKKKLEIEKLRSELELSRAKRQSLENNYAPITLLQDFTVRFGRHLGNALKQQFTSLLKELQRRKIIDQNQLEGYTKQMIDTLNNGVKTAKDELKKDVELATQKMENK